MARKGGPTFKDMMEPGFSSEHPETWKSNLDSTPRKKPMTFKPAPPEVEAEAADDPMLHVAQMLNSYIGKSSVSFTIGMPMTVTATKKDGTYSKRPMIGGESFRILKVYVGKRKSLICCFTPLQVSDFLTIEMSMAEAKKAFGTDFAAYIDKSDGGSIGDALKEATKTARDMAEAEKNEGKAEQYSDIGFGSW